MAFSNLSAPSSLSWPCPPLDQISSSSCFSTYLGNWDQGSVQKLQQSKVLPVISLKCLLNLPPSFPILLLPPCFGSSFCIPEWLSHSTRSFHLPLKKKISIYLPTNTYIYLPPELLVCFSLSSTRIYLCISIYIFYLLSSTRIAFWKPILFKSLPCLEIVCKYN